MMEKGVAKFLFILYYSLKLDGFVLKFHGLQAEVAGSVSADDQNHPEFQLKKYDFFGFGNKPFPCCDGSKLHSFV